MRENECSYELIELREGRKCRAKVTSVHDQSSQQHNLVRAGRSKLVILDKMASKGEIV